MLHREWCKGRLTLNRKGEYKAKLISPHALRFRNPAPD